MVLITLVTNGTHFLLEDQGAKFEDNRLFTSFVPSVMTDQVIIHCMMCITLLTVMLVFFRAMSKQINIKHKCDVFISLASEVWDHLH